MQSKNVCYINWKKLKKKKKKDLLRLHIKYSLQFYDNNIDNFVRIALHVTTLYVNKIKPHHFSKKQKTDKHANYWFYAQEWQLSFFVAVGNHLIMHIIFNGYCSLSVDIRLGPWHLYALYYIKEKFLIERPRMVEKVFSMNLWISMVNCDW